MPHTIPKRVFQVIVLFLLLVCLPLIVYWIFSESGLYYILRSWTGEAWKGIALLLTCFALCIIWLLITLLWRALTDIAPMKPRKGSRREEFNQLINLVQTKNAEPYQAQTYTPELKRRVRRNALVFFLIGILLMMPASLEQGHLLGLQVALFITGTLMVVAGLFQMITGRSIVRRR